MGSKRHITLVTGGARSGKSALAERLVRRYGMPLIYIATAEPRDGEMAARVKEHQTSRGEGWTTVEAPRSLEEALEATDGQGARLVDCLTLWLANGEGAADTGRLLVTLRQQSCPVVLVTNELGQGIVPADRLTRRFRDDHGRMNQEIAALADEVWLAVSGQPLRLKPMKDDPDAPV